MGYSGKMAESRLVTIVYLEPILNKDFSRKP